MHELSIALSIVDRALQESRARGGARIEAVFLRIGQLSGVDADALRFSFGIACDQAEVAGCRLEINEVPVSMDCPNCGAETRTVSVQQLCCSECGTPALEIIHGRELELQAMEILE
jgi:hydrogenase nickel incorporation protein HypA/HybF